MGIEKEKKDNSDWIYSPFRECYFFPLPIRYQNTEGEGLEKLGAGVTRAGNTRGRSDLSCTTLV